MSHLYLTLMISLFKYFSCLLLYIVENQMYQIEMQYNGPLRMYVMAKDELTLMFGVFVRSRVIQVLQCHFPLPFHFRLIGTVCQRVSVSCKTSSCCLLIANWNLLWCGRTVDYRIYFQNSTNRGEGLPFFNFKSQSFSGLVSLTQFFEQFKSFLLCGISHFGEAGRLGGHTETPFHHGCGTRLRKTVCSHEN